MYDYFSHPSIKQQCSLILPTNEVHTIFIHSSSCMTFASFIQWSAFLNWSSSEGALS